MKISDYRAATLTLNQFIAESQEYRADIQRQIGEIRINRIKGIKRELDATIKNLAGAFRNATPSVKEFSKAISNFPSCPDIPPMVMPIECEPVNPHIERLFVKPNVGEYASYFISDYQALPWYKKLLCWISKKYKSKFIDIK